MGQPGERYSGAYFFLPAGACFAATACAFFWLALAAFTCFCFDALFTDFGDLSPMDGCG